MSHELTTLPRVGLALAGGVMEGGFYEVGVLCALEEAVDGLDCTRLHAYVGVSAGAVVTSMLANGIAPRTIARAIVGRAGDELSLDLDILFTPAFGEYARRIGKLPATLARWVRRRLERPFDVSLVGSLLELGALAPSGLFDSTPMQRYLERLFCSGGRTDDFRVLDTVLRVIAVKLDTAQLVAFGGPGTQHVPISKAVQASIALPGLYCPVEIDGEHYIDGVARRTLNASAALDEGVDLLFCINPIVPVDLHAGAGNGHGRTLAAHGLPSVLSQTLRTMIHSRMGTGFRSYAHQYPTADVVLVEPRPDDHRMFFSNIFSISNRREVCEHGYANGRATLRARADELEPVLRRHGLTLRRDVLADSGRSLFPDLPPLPSRAPRRTLLGDALGRLEDALDRLSAIASPR